MFYVYEHLRNDNNAIFYVGKGKDYRSKEKKNRNQHWSNVVNKANGYSVRYVIKNVDEELAYLCECERIDQLKKVGVNLTNLTIGGEGAGSGKNHHMWGKVHPQKGVKRPWVGKSGADNPMYGKPSPMRGVSKPKGKDSPLYGRKRPEGGGKPARPVVRINDGVEFESVAAAARSVNGKGTTISKCCLGKAKEAYGYQWKYKE